MALAPFASILLQRVGAPSSGTDGTTVNDKRTLPIYVGGQNYTIILRDSAGVQSGTKVQVNNANSIDKNKPHHAVHPLSYGNQSQFEVLENAGAVGGQSDPLKESSASASDFDTNWIDVPGGAEIDSSDGYVGSGAWRWIRLTHGSGLNATLSGYVFGAQYQGFSN